MGNQEILAMSAAIAAVAFVFLCGFLIALLRTARQSLLAAESTLKEVKQTVEELRGEVGKLASSVNDAAFDVKGKLQSTDPFFAAIQDVGAILSDVTGTARKAARKWTDRFQKQAESAQEHAAESTPPQWLKWAAIGSRLAIGLKKGKDYRAKRPYPQAKEGY
ncbi:DUF948 domain-containing protein [Cohnella sp. LGH]|uniref:Uncharacterized protein YoxC n=1 Tax=Cohnella phaseoli TaxID=456490 RepID=A0A3D9I5R2_9BACL|nr:MULTISPECIES: DUF948 domain-containing protein [Cohnella]QTH40253.1 DUF948 domain-containing protein [Cohnella sp. LGH]RED56516.1 uncharacterized protein YoxC [Cohnella phaseoli]